MRNLYDVRQTEALREWRACGIALIPCVGCGTLERPRKAVDGLCDLCWLLHRAKDGDYVYHKETRRHLLLVSGPHCSYGRMVQDADGNRWYESTLNLTR